MRGEHHHTPAHSPRQLLAPRGRAPCAALLSPDSPLLAGAWASPPRTTRYGDGRSLPLGEEFARQSGAARAVLLEIDEAGGTPRLCMLDIGMHRRRPRATHHLLRHAGIMPSGSWRRRWFSPALTSGMVAVRLLDRRPMVLRANSRPMIRSGRPHAAGCRHRRIGAYLGRIVGDTARQMSAAQRKARHGIPWRLPQQPGGCAVAGCGRPSSMPSCEPRAGLSAAPLPQAHRPPRATCRQHAISEIAGGCHTKACLSLSCPLFRARAGPPGKVVDRITLTEFGCPPDAVRRGGAPPPPPSNRRARFRAVTRPVVGTGHMHMARQPGPPARPRSYGLGCAVDDVAQITGVMHVERMVHHHDPHGRRPRAAQPLRHGLDLLG